MEKKTHALFMLLGVLLALSALSPALAHSPASRVEEATRITPIPSVTPVEPPTPELAGTEPEILPAEPRPVPEGQAVPQKEGLNTAGQIWVWTDRGCGPSVIYNPGDPITFYYKAAQSGSATLYLHKPDSTQVIWSGTMQPIFR